MNKCQVQKKVVDMKRNTNLDIFRATALLLVMIYHGWVLTGSHPFCGTIITLLVSLGGEIGVTAFFALSGYGIYCSLQRMEQGNGKIDYLKFLKKRAKRIYPDYVFCMGVVVLLSLPAYLSWNGIKNIVTHLLMIHNLFPAYCGSINGVLWTMGVIVQFYIIAPVLYRLMNKYGVRTEIICILFTIVMKAIMYALILPATGHSEDLAFFSGRQLITSLDNFTVGMLVAYLLKNKENVLNGETAGIGMLVSVIGLICVCQFGMNMGIHTNNMSGYIWHSLLALQLGLLMFCVSYMKYEHKGLCVKGLLWLSKYEYGIYIWHLLILSKLLSYMKNLKESLYWWIIYLIYIPLSIFVGFFAAYVLKKILQRRTEKHA